MTSRAIALVAGSALVALVAGAVRLAAADPLVAQEPPRPAHEARRAPRPDPPAEAPAAAAAAAGQWTARKQVGVSAGVLVRAASRHPLDRGAACTARERRGDDAAAGERCTPVAPRAEPIEIDWHGDRASP